MFFTDEFDDFLANLRYCPIEVSISFELQSFEYVCCKMHCQQSWNTADHYLISNTVDHFWYLKAKLLQMGMMRIHPEEVHLRHPDTHSISHFSFTYWVLLQRLLLVQLVSTILLRGPLRLRLLTPLRLPRLA